VAPLDDAARRFVEGDGASVAQKSADVPSTPQKAAEGPPETSAKVRRRRKRERRPPERVGLVQREAGVRRQMTLYVRPETADRFKAWCRSQGRELSHAADEALAKFLEGK
jgi:hypothetical protein